MSGSGPHTEDLAFKLWKDAYAEGFAAGWDRGLDRAVLLLRGKIPAQVEAVLVELAGVPEEPAPRP